MRSLGPTTERTHSETVLSSREARVPTYRFSLMSPDGGLAEEYTGEFADDDDAIDHAGGLGHLYDIDVWDGQRLVAHFPPAGSWVSR